MADHERPERQLDLLSFSLLGDEAPAPVAEKLAVRWVSHDAPGRVGQAAWPGSGVGLEDDLAHLRQHHRATVLLAVAEDAGELVEAARRHELDVRHLAPGAKPEALAQQAAGLAADLRAGRRTVVVSRDPSAAALPVACALVILGRTVDEALRALGGSLEPADAARLAAFALRTGRAEAEPAEVAPAEVAPAEVAPAEVAPAEVAPAEITPAAPVVEVAPRAPSAEVAPAHPEDGDPGPQEELLAVEEDDHAPFLEDDPFAEEPAPAVTVAHDFERLARSPRKARLLGAVLGGAIGDAMGHPTEFIRSFQAIRERFGPDGVTGYELWRTEGGRRFAPYTDDTQMAECVLRSLLWGREQSADLDATMRDMGARFVEWARAPQGGHRAPGNACLAGCRSLERGVPWHEAGGATAGGCGSVMRAYPFGLVFAHDLERAERWAVAHSKLTHRDPIALAASAAMAVGVARVMRDEPVELVLSEMVAAACRYSPKTAGMMARAIDEAWSGVGPETTLERLEGWAAHEAIAAAVYLFARHPDDPRAAILEGANTPGDSDSLATLAGALVGARVGIGAFPAEWVRDLERVDELAALALQI
jgi:ADP-ribosylglycohydrolase